MLQRRTGGEHARRRPRWRRRALALLLLLGLSTLCGGSAPIPSPRLDMVSATNPTPPSGVSAVGGDGQLALTWTASTELTTSGYRVYLDGVPTTTTSGTSVTLTGLVNGRTYVITVATLSDFLGTTYEGTTRSDPVNGTPHDGLPPATPAGLTATGGDREIVLSWTAAADLEVRSYELERDGVLIATPGAGATGYTDTGRTNGVTHAYSLVAVDVAGQRSPAATASATARDAVAPAAPAGLVATGADREVSLSWAANAEYDVSGYRVLRDGVQVALVSGTSYLDTGLVNGTSYAYTLVAVDTSDNESAASSPAVVVTPRDGVAPGAPTGLAATPGDREVLLSWNANAEYDVSGYRVLRDGVQVALVSGTSYLDTGLVNGTSYAYTLVAVDTSDNDSVPSSPQVDATPRDGVAPTAPTGLVATPGDREMALSWTANPEYDVLLYRVLRDGVEVAAVVGTTYRDTGLVNGTSYVYTLVAVDSSGNESVPSGAVTATAADAVPPAAPTGLAAVAGRGQVTLSWDANAEADLVGYRVLRDGAEIAAVTGTSYVDTAVVNGTTYAYSVVAVDSSGNRSPESAAVAATPSDAPPAAPTGVSGSAGDGRALVRWTAVAEDDVTAYRVLNQDGSTAVEVLAPATEATVTGLTNGTTYRFTVVAVDAAGNVSSPSAEVAVTPAAATTVPVEGAGQSGGLAVSSNGRFVVVGTRAQLEASDTNTAYELYLVDRDAGTERRLLPLSASATGSSDPSNTSAPAISDDGRYVALATTARLVAGDTNTLADVYRLDTQTGTWALASVPLSGAVSAGTAGTVLQAGTSVYATSPTVVISGDGDLVLFYSARADLVTGDNNGAVDLFAKRMSTGAVTRVSTTATGGNLTRVATGPALALTPDGRFALFPAASATGPAVLYRKTLSGAGAGAITVVSSVVVSGSTTEFGVYRDAGDIAISDDGQYVAFVTAAKVDTATPGASYSTGFAYRKDTVTGALLALGSGQRTMWEHKVELDPTGRFGYFSTAAAALPADTNGHTDFYRRDLGGGVAGPLVLVTADAAGAPTTGPSGSVTSAEYGRLLAATADRVLVTTAQALLPADTNGLRDLYAKDLSDGAVGTPLG